MADSYKGGFVRDALGRLVIIAAGAGLIETQQGGFVRDENHRIVVVGPEGKSIGGGTNYLNGSPGVAASSVPYGIMQASETLIAKKLYFSRFYVPETTTFKKAKFVVTNASTKDNGVAIAVYKVDGKKRVASTAKVQELMLSGGVKTMTLEWTATANTVYYAAFIAEEATPEAGTVGKVTAVGPNVGTGNEIFGTTVPNKLAMAATGIAVPPPEELTEVPANTQTAVPLIYFTTE